MSQSRKRRCCVLEEDSEDQSDTQHLINARVPVPVEEDSSSSSSTCSSSFSVSSCSSCSSFSCSNSLSCSPPMLSSPEEDFTAAGNPVFPQSPQGTCSSLPAMASALGSPSDEGSISGGFESPSSYHVLPSAEVLSSSERDEKVTNLLNFLLMKYQMKELVTEAEIMNIIQNYSHFFVIFSEVYECLQLVFGVDMKVVEPLDHTYVLVTILGISYDGLLSEVQGMPKTGLLVLILSIIFLQGDRAPEEEIWRTLNVMGIWAGVQHFIYGDPRKLILEDFVQEQYLVYQQVPNSNPARYEFLWGPRAHAETSKLKILEFLAGISGNDHTFFGQRYEEALRDEEEKVQARIAAAFAPASASCGATSSFFYPK